MTTPYTVLFCLQSERQKGEVQSHRGTWCSPTRGHGQSHASRESWPASRWSRTGQERATESAQARGQVGSLGRWEAAGCQGTQSFQRSLGLRQDSLFKLSIPRKKGLIDLEGQKEQFIMRMGREVPLTRAHSLQFKSVNSEPAAVGTPL